MSSTRSVVSTYPTPGTQRADVWACVVGTFKSAQLLGTRFVHIFVCNDMYFPQSCNMTFQLLVLLISNIIIIQQVAPKTLNYLAFDFERSWWWLFQKRVVRPNLISTFLLLSLDRYLRPVVSVSALTWFIRYIYYWNLQFLNNVIIDKTKVLLLRHRWL